MLGLIVGVDALGRVGGGVAEDVLDFGQAGAAIEQHAGLGVAEVVGGGRYAHAAGVALDGRPDRLGPEPPALAAVAGRLAAAGVGAPGTRAPRGAAPPPV